MALPKAIQQQVDDADAFVAQLNGQPPTGETNPQPNPEPPPEPEPPKQPVSQEPQPNPTPDVPEDTWQAKFFTLKGKYDAEVPRLHAQMRELNTQVQTLLAETAARASQSTPEPTPAKTLITEQDKEAFGSDLLDLIDRATESKISGFRDRESQLQAEIAELKGKLGNVTERQVVSDKDRFISALASQVPDWEALNVDQGFLTWLAEVDPVYGLPRQAALNGAYEAFDANRTAAIFKQYKALVTPAQQTTQNRDLQRQVAPTRSRSTAAPATSSAEKKIYSQQEISTFYNDWMKGHLNSAEAEQMEREIHAAINEGRVR
jgi:hypothetical protein